MSRPSPPLRPAAAEQRHREEALTARACNLAEVARRSGPEEQEEPAGQAVRVDAVARQALEAQQVLDLALAREARVVLAARVAAVAVRQRLVPEVASSSLRSAAAVEVLALAARVR